MMTIPVIATTKLGKNSIVMVCKGVTFAQCLDDARRRLAKLVGTKVKYYSFKLDKE